MCGASRDLPEGPKRVRTPALPGVPGKIATPLKGLPNHCGQGVWWWEGAYTADEKDFVNNQCSYRSLFDSHGNALPAMRGLGRRLARLASSRKCYYNLQPSYGKEPISEWPRSRSLGLPVLRFPPFPPVNPVVFPILCVLCALCGSAHRHIVAYRYIFVTSCLRGKNRPPVAVFVVSSCRCGQTPYCSTRIRSIRAIRGPSNPPRDNYPSSSFASGV